MQQLLYDNRRERDKHYIKESHVETSIVEFSNLLFNASAVVVLSKHQLDLILAYNIYEIYFSHPHSVLFISLFYFQLNLVYELSDPLQPLTCIPLMLCYK